MKIRYLLFVLLVSLLAVSVTAEDLSDYPELFMKGQNLNVITIVGDKAPATHVLAQTQIALSLSNEVGKQVPGLTRLASEVDRIENVNVISIGNACDNPTSAEILGNPSPCNQGLNKNTATIELFENENGRFHLVLNAYGDVGIRKLADVLVNYDTFPLNGNTFDVSISGEQERDFVETEDAPEPVLIQESTNEREEVEEPQEEAEVEEEVEEEAELESEGGSAQDSINLGDDEPQPILPEEKNIVIRFINWLKSLFG